MPEADVSPDFLHEVLEGRVFASASELEGELAAIARACRAITAPGPGRAAEQRIESAISAIVTGARRGPWWSGGGDGMPLVHKLAAAVALTGLVGGGASLATGVSPAEFASGAGGTIRAVVMSLNPNNGDGALDASQPTSTPTISDDAATTPSPPPAATAVPTTVSPTASGTPAPGTPAASATVDDDDEGEDDNSGPGSGNSGSGSDNSGPGSANSGSGLGGDDSEDDSGRGGGE